MVTESVWKSKAHWQLPSFIQSSRIYLTWFLKEREREQKRETEKERENEKYRLIINTKTDLFMTIKKLLVRDWNFSCTVVFWSPTQLHVAFEGNISAKQKYSQLSYGKTTGLRDWCRILIMSRKCRVRLMELCQFNAYGDVVPHTLKDGEQNPR